MITVNNGLKLPAALVLVSVSVLLGGCIGGPRMYKAQVRQEGNLPCFSVEDNRETRKSPPEIAVIGVSVYRQGVAQNVWLRNYPPEEPAFTLSPQQCVPYGEDGQALPIETGERYTVSINSFIGKRGEWHNRAYSAYFCVTADQHGKTTVHQVVWNEDKGGYDWSICE